MLHSIDNYTFEQFQTHLQIEVQSRMRELQGKNSKVNLVIETGLIMTQNNLKVQKKGNKFKKKQNANKKHRVCFHCGNKRHYIKECRFKNFNKKGGSFKVNMVEKRRCQGVSCHGFKHSNWNDYQIKYSK